MGREILFKIAKWIIRKWFKDGLKPVMASDDSGRVIAWKWMFYDEQYEKEFYGGLNKIYKSSIASAPPPPPPRHPGRK